MADGKPNPLKLIKEFFETPEKPVTSTELVRFKKEDPSGFAQVRDGLVDGSLTY